MRKFLSILLLFPVFSLAFSQTINLDFPHFGGQEYVFCLLKGEKSDTIYRGALDKHGKSTIVVPAAYKDFVGMARWSLITGGGLEMVLNKEKEFTIRCSEAHPSEKTIFYTHTPENEFMYGQFMRQANVINKALACRSLLQQYEPSDDVYRFVGAEQQRLEGEFADIQRGTRKSPLYAARIREYYDFLTHTGSRMNLNAEEISAERREFFMERLNLQQLYNSGFWKDVIEAHIASVAENDSLLVADSRVLLSRAAGNKAMEEELLQKLTLLYHKYGKENLLVNLGVEDLVSVGRLAPMLRLSNKYIRPVNSLVFFYESGCGFCENELTQLRGNYPLLQEKGIEVISISADRDEAAFNEHAQAFPWHDKYCDYQGFYGENFRNYDIKGTPVIFLVDKDGIITGKHARISEIEF